MFSWWLIDVLFILVTDDITIGLDIVYCVFTFYLSIFGGYGCEGDATWCVAFSFLCFLWPRIDLSVFAAMIFAPILLRDDDAYPTSPFGKRRFLSFFIS